ncbi:primosomal protein N' (replication factor Y) [Pullulanibacillus pueri]|uniref:Replication restart protein PriA n=1 Tax=Pullulanibacillus pueri TaxID=1437324 RepID=A0A8J3EJJ1_9BACL|nr:primosomal protein N' [Pullulanibacillus pueri]MBM7680180.1 primosomal protein N' (replication factor Y) [Pullulanibacillus pueri]GGH74757.1 primosomal protein N' [Pullulanibacillus pueri]
MIAEVIVDLALNQTDKPFDYSIPESLQPLVERGARVIVPFGPRKLVGFVVAIKSDTALEKVRPIHSVIDQTPVLTDELLQLGKWLAKETLCYEISAFLAMLPAAMKASYKKVISVADAGLFENEFMDLLFLFKNGEQIEWESLQKTHGSWLKRIKEALQAGALKEHQQVNQGQAVKKMKVVQPALTYDELKQSLETFKGRAKKQRDVLTFFLEQESPTAIAVNEVIRATNVSRATIKTLVQKGFLIETEKEVYRDPFQGSAKPTIPLELTDEQQAAIHPVLEDLDERRHRVHLCHGVTGSGKTEIYLQAIQRVLEKGQEAIVLVPEISLTPQMVERFRGRFGDEVAVLHSGLSRGEKYDEWRKIHRGEVRVVVGARSAVFAPFTNVGIIIIDEEHETSYKQEESPRYHARDVAIFRGEFHHCPVILGSATPSLESYARAQKGVYRLAPLLKRVNQKPMPPVSIIDMREELRAGNRSMFSRDLFQSLQERLRKGEQSVLFLNRRGYSTFIMCRDCGHVLSCPHCDISLTFHRKNNKVKCHYCGFEEQVPHQCPSCGSEHIRFFGSGTQKVEEALTTLLPEARVIRMDVDTTRKKGAHERFLKAFGRGEADILLGTQMIAKGLDFEKVTLVGVLAADAMLHLPDFRSTEKTFQLLTQVGGRAGRHQLDGEVIIQSYTPEHYAMTLAAEHDYQHFYLKEMQSRKRHDYPPFYYLSLITVSHESFARASGVAEQITRLLAQELTSQAIILGPVAPPIARIKDRYRCQCMIKYKNEPKLKQTLKNILDHYQGAFSKEGLSISMDIDPYLMM